MADLGSIEPAILRNPRAGFCHVWMVDFTNLLLQDMDLSLLTSAEQERLCRLRQQHDRIAFGAMRVALKRLAARYVDDQTKVGQVSLSPRGKPSFIGAPELHFNVSHSAGRGVVALTDYGPVGVDNEPVKRFTSFSVAFWSKVLAPTELINRERQGSPTSDAFIWVQKEAVLKMLGVGIALPMDSFAVTNQEISVCDTRKWQQLDIDVAEVSACRLWSGTWGGQCWAVCLADTMGEPEIKPLITAEFFKRRSHADPFGAGVRD